MPKPATTAEFGTIVTTAPARPARSRHARFADVKMYATKAMPTVKIGQVYRDLDPRCAGRLIQVLKITANGRVLVRTVNPRTCPPRTPSQTTKNTAGAVSWIALRRFRENSRGFALVRGTPLRTIQSYLLGARLAAACDIAMSELDTKTADVLIGLLGNRLAHEYLDDWLNEEPDEFRKAYMEGGIALILRDAVTFASEEGLFESGFVVAPRDATRRIARTVEA